MALIKEELDLIENLKIQLDQEIDNLIGKKIDDEDQKRLNDLGINFNPVKLS